MSDPSVGTSSQAGKIAAIIFVVVVGLGIVIVLPVALSFFESERVELVDGEVRESLEPTGDGGCTYRVEFAVHSPNRPEGHVWVVDADVRLRRFAPLREDSVTEGRVFESLPAVLLYEMNPCPASVDDIDHGDLEVTYRKKNQQSTRTVRFGF